jgi:hypothetical protein
MPGVVAVVLIVFVTRAVMYCTEVGFRRWLAARDVPCAVCGCDVQKFSVKQPALCEDCFFYGPAEKEVN